MEVDERVTLICGDCLDYLRTLPDDAFDLAVVDPPYSALGGATRIGGTWASKYGKNIKSWDIAPTQEYFQELFRVSRNQIIWGGNYFHLPPTRCFLVWRKLSISDKFTMAMADYAWTSFESNAKVFECAPQGTRKDPRFHPTQKPVKLYDWIFGKYARPGDRILDTHLGSGSSAIAAHNAGLEFVGIELNEEYFDKMKERVIKHTQVTPKIITKIQ